MDRLTALYELATAYHACRDVDSLFKTLAASLRACLGPGAILLWLPEEGREGMRCRGKWFAPGQRFEPAAAVVQDGLLAEIAELRSARRLSGAEKKAGLLSHLEPAHRERVANALYAPIPAGTGRGGVLEVLNKEAGEFTADDAGYAEEAGRMSGHALDTLRSAEAERNAQFATVERLTALYDISRIFNSTLELTDLCPIITGKIRDLLGAGACNLWLVAGDGSKIEFAHQDGEDPTTEEDGTMALGEGFLGAIAREGQARVVPDASEEPQLANRRESGAFTLATCMAAPLLEGEKVTGVIEVVNKLDGTAFDEDDLFFLTTISEQAALALHNARLLDSERKVHELDALLEISKQITSTLDLDHILTTVVHQAATVVPFDRCSIGLVDRDRLILAAVSGEAEVPKTKEMARLRDVLELVADQNVPVSADQYDTGWQVSHETAREKIVSYLTEEGRNGFYALPLRDDQGTLGVLALESSDAEFLGASQLETLAILGSQISVAVRNARLYQSLPLRGVLAPVAKTREKLREAGLGRRLETATKIGLAVLALVVVPLKLRVAGNSSVVPAERRVVSAEVEGVVRRVLVHEGDLVAAGAPLAQLDDSETRVAFERAKEKLALAQRDLSQAESRQDLAAATQARLHMDMEQAEVTLNQVKFARTRLEAPIAGIVVTPKVEEKTGRFLARGDPFCEVVERDRMAAEVQVPETDVSLVRAGRSVALKLNAFPTETFSGAVERVSAQTIAADNEQFFVVRIVFENPGGRARTGMVGRAKITASGGPEWFESGWYPSGYVILRDPARWAWRKLWTWLP
jgi:RND family efflux transporter MFP subunit